MISDTAKFTSLQSLVLDLWKNGRTREKMGRTMKLSCYHVYDCRNYCKTNLQSGKPWKFFRSVCNVRYLLSGQFILAKFPGLPPWPVRLLEFGPRSNEVTVVSHSDNAVWVYDSVRGAPRSFQTGPEGSSVWTAIPSGRASINLSVQICCSYLGWLVPYLPSGPRSSCKFLSANAEVYSSNFRQG